MEQWIWFGLNSLFSSLSGLLMYYAWYFLYEKADREPDVRTAYAGLKALLVIYLSPFAWWILYGRRREYPWAGSFAQGLALPIQIAAGILAVIWAAGALGVLLHYLKDILWAWRANREMIEADIRMHRLAAEVADRLGIKRKIRVMEGYVILSPELGGWLRPVIRLPIQEYGDEELRCIFTHELTHLRNGDVFIREWMLAVLCVYWFSPVCKKMLRQLCVWSEIQCDEEVCACSFIDRKKYIETLLRAMDWALNRKSEIAPGICEKNSDLERRIKVMKRNRGRKRRKGGLALAVALAFGIVGSGTALAAASVAAGLCEKAVEASAAEQGETESPGEACINEPDGA